MHQIFRHLWPGLAFLSLLFATFAPAAPGPVSDDYRLDIAFDLQQGTLHGTAVIGISSGEDLVLHSGSLTITGLLLKRQDAEQPVAIPASPLIRLDAVPYPRELIVTYSYTPKNDRDNRIADDGIVLLSGWHPQPLRKMQYHLSASLPPGFTAISESTVVPLPQQGNTVTAIAPHPLSAMHFAAARYAADRLQIREGLWVHTLFFAEDRQLAKEYLEKARQYILRFEEAIGPYPYDAFTIVANRNPTGLGMPGFTLLGQAVLRLPFIKDTSLGHEILHSWFGNSVDVADGQANWCEGLTSYLADQQFRAEIGEGPAARKELIVNYLSYVNEQNAMALNGFGDAGHSQPLAQARRAVGYGRAALLFHELEMLIGHERFMEGVRQFYASHRNSGATWDDLRRAMSAAAPETELDRFFQERLTRTDIPTVHAEDIEVAQQQEGNILRFTLVQDTTEPYMLQLPIRIATMAGDHQATISTSQLRHQVVLPLPTRPLSFNIDPEYSLLRQLAGAERPPVWSQIMGSSQLRIVLESQEAATIYRPLLDLLAGPSTRIGYDGEILNADLQASDLVFLGIHQQSVKSIFARPEIPQEGFTLAMHHNPLNPARTIALVSGANPGEVGAIASRLNHYGKYTYLHGLAGRITEKRLEAGDQGIAYQLEELPAAVPSARLQDFAATADQLAAHDVIYIGETHTSVSDHRLQLRLIEALAARVPRLAIGLEMFPGTSQTVLDGYFTGNNSMTERDFIKKSRYFEVWQYDYRYYREIFTLARNNRIPVIGLNLERDIVSTVYRTGGTDALTPVVRSRLPEERDLTLPGYGERLRSMHAIHQDGGHGSGAESGFIQAQSIWDETMAENMVNYLRANPGTTMVVLAGSEHTRKDSGIPPRAARRMALNQAVVANLAERPEADALRDIADYLFFSQSLELADAPKMGVLLETRAVGGSSHLQISGFSPESRAESAGLRQGDIVRAIGSIPVTDMADVRIAMIDAETAETIDVEIERIVEDHPLTLHYTVPLVHLAPQEPPPTHPRVERDEQVPPAPTR